MPEIIIVHIRISNFNSIKHIDLLNPSNDNWVYVTETDAKFYTPKGHQLIYVYYTILNIIFIQIT